MCIRDRLGRWTCDWRSRVQFQPLHCRVRPGQVVHTHCSAPLKLRPYGAINQFNFKQITSATRKIYGISEVRVGLQPAASTRILFGQFTTRVICFYYSSTRYFLFPVANFHFRLQFFAVIWRIVWIWAYGNSGLRDFICSLASLETDPNICRGGASQPAAGKVRRADPPPVLRHWQLALKSFRC